MDESVRLLSCPFSLYFCLCSLRAPGVICLCTGLCHSKKTECSFCSISCHHSVSTQDRIRQYILLKATACQQLITISGGETTVMLLPWHLESTHSPSVIARFFRSLLTNLLDSVSKYFILGEYGNFVMSCINTFTSSHKRDYKTKKLRYSF